jgi:hypothetical protein
MCTTLCAASDSRGEWYAIRLEAHNLGSLAVWADSTIFGRIYVTRTSLDELVWAITEPPPPKDYHMPEIRYGTKMKDVSNV